MCVVCVCVGVYVCWFIGSVCVMCVWCVWECMYVGSLVVVLCHVCVVCVGVYVCWFIGSGCVSCMCGVCGSVCMLVHW